MIYSQFQQSPFQTRFSGAKGWMAFAIGIAVITLALIALPFLLLFGAISFILLSLFGRLFLKRQLAKFKQQQAQGAYTDKQQQSNFSTASEQQNQQIFTDKAFADKRHQAEPHQGRTYEHDPS
ncbi:hypothetical protein FM037_01310 [Shewanella psychropiezotolerans]|uniref:Uncharacterized protein n=1 Tax=Shewanella psychropiezotolerans TaxID=2593655 RepID=A0ABX5WSX8_9GAMM|nr:MULTISPECIES: hypothetical protein [Shewanella]MPY26754.1 hypothetical protein [Shewanella sp. YLB-07]QDO82114.1 hypothetical protein FM037_01310 [Shewanella psychropiezotolerans]